MITPEAHAASVAAAHALRDLALAMRELAPEDQLYLAAQIEREAHRVCTAAYFVQPEAKLCFDPDHFWHLATPSWQR